MEVGAGGGYGVEITECAGGGSEVFQLLVEEGVVEVGGIGVEGMAGVAAGEGGLATGEGGLAAGEVEGVVAEWGGLFEEVEEGMDVAGVDGDVNLNDPRNPALLQGFFRTSRRGRCRPVKAAIVIRRHRQGHRCR